MVGLTGARFGGAAGRRRRAAPRPQQEAGTIGARHQRGEQPQVGQTGARFPPILTRWRDGQPAPEVPDPAPLARATPHRRKPAARNQVTPPVVEPLSRRPEPSGPRLDPAPPATGSSRDDESGWLTEADWGADGLVRPYSWTAGRTSSRFELSFETLISATGREPDGAAAPGHRTILTLCATPHSVAELAALLSIPLGVAKVVLGDMAEAGSVMVHRTAGSTDGAPDLDLMHRVLQGLQRL